MMRKVFCNEMKLNAILDFIFVNYCTVNHYFKLARIKVHENTIGLLKHLIRSLICPPCYCSVIWHSANYFFQKCYTNLAVMWVQFIVTKEGKRKAVDFQSHQTYFQHSTHVFLHSYFSLKMNRLWLKRSKAYLILCDIQQHGLIVRTQLKYHPVCSRSL